MSVRLTLLCHASTSAVRRAAFPLDEPIDPQGHARASALAGSWRRADAAWTSPALRARETAEAMRLAAGVDPLLRDIDVGRWAGRSFAEVQATDAAAVEAWTSAAGAAPHGGESITDLLERIGPWLAAMGRAPGRVVAVTHAAVIRAAIVLALDAPPMAFWRIDVAPLCRVALGGDGGRWTLRSISAEHRPD